MPDVAKQKSLCFLFLGNPRFYKTSFEEKASTRFEEKYKIMIPELQKRGVSSVWVGDEILTKDDFFDDFHLNEQGGEKLAWHAAAKVVELAKQMNYFSGK